MAELLEYKCPCCGGAIAFDSKLQKMKCPYCDTEFDLETLRKYDEQLQQDADASDDMKWEIPAGSEWEEGETDGLRTYICQSCGGEIIGDESMAATSCPFCGNPVVVMRQFQGDLRPDKVIPFQLGKEEAKAGLRKHLQGKRLLPKMFSNENHIDEIKGIYVPFWLFESGATAQVRYHATKVRVWSDSNYNYTETRHYLVQRGGDLSFENVPVDGSSKMADDLMESIEPFDYSKAVDFQTAYLAGYLADRYDVDAQSSEDRADQRIRHSTEEVFASTVQGYATVVPENSNIQLSGGKIEYVLYPVWLLNTTWKNKQYTFAMNGQTGKFVGDLPVDTGAARRWTAGLAVALSAAAYGFIYLLHGIGII